MEKHLLTLIVEWIPLSETDINKSEKANVTYDSISFLFEHKRKLLFLETLCKIPPVTGLQ